MKTPTINLIKTELLATEFDKPLFTIKRISGYYVNEHLIRFIKRLLKDVKSTDEKEKMLIRLKKVIIQTLREPDPFEVALDPFEFREFLIRIKKEQAFYEPIRWITAELECLVHFKENIVTSKDKDWLTKEEFLAEFDMSISTFNRRIAEGMPVYAIGTKPFIYRPEFTKWLLTQKIEVEF